MQETHKKFAIFLLTQPQFLRMRLPLVRQALLGEGKPSISRKQARQEPSLKEIDELSVASKGASEESSPAVLSSKRQSWLKRVLGWFLTMIMVVSGVLIAIVIVPNLYFSLTSGQTAYDEISQAARLERGEMVESPKEPEPYQPELNTNLPEGQWIHIPRIGVYSQLLATENPDEALDVGVWMVPDFGTPGDQELPIIVAAHRFGWDWWWKNDYWRYNSFYLLTETEPGDRVEIMYDQRKWVYEIYAAEEGTLITDYDADLILYTCKHLKSPIRYFRYAKLLEL